MSQSESKYAIFQCEKCKRWIYARSAQKTSKCGLCQKSNRVPEHPRYTADKPTAALLKINELNQAAIIPKSDQCDFESKGRYKPVTLTPKINHQITTTKPSLSNASINQSINKSKQFQAQKFDEENKDNNQNDTIKANTINALKRFQIEKRIQKHQGIPLAMIPLILRNAGIKTTEIAIKKIIALLIRERIAEYTNRNTAI